jgi:hypothetical protein
MSGRHIAEVDIKIRQQAVAHAQQRAYVTCRESYLSSHYGSFVGKKLIPFFSLGTLWDSPGEYARSAAEAALVKGTPILIAGKYGSQAVKGALHVGGRVLAWVGAVLTVATTAADVGARQACGGF